MPETQEFIAPASWRTVEFISDLHLQAKDKATQQIWQRYIQSTPTDALFILGDFFEVWVGDDAIDEPGSFEADCCKALHGAAQRLPIYFMHGNRDFLVDGHFLQQCGITGIADPTVLEFHGLRLLLSHGDALCIDDLEYQQFRELARSAHWQQNFLSQPLAKRRAQALAIREQSDERKRTGAFYPDVDTPTAQHWLAQCRASILIHGHTHRPADHSLSQGLQRIVLSDWAGEAIPPRAEVLRLSVDGLKRVPLK